MLNCTFHRCGQHKCPTMDGHTCWMQICTDCAKLFRPPRRTEQKYVNRRLECKFWPLLLPTSSHPRTHLCTGPNQIFRRYSQRKALDYVWQLGLISERILIFAAFLYERAFIGIVVTNGLKSGSYKPELKNVRANAILLYGVVLTTCAKEKYWICTVPS